MNVGRREMRRTVQTIAAVLLAGAAYAGMPSLSPDVLARSCAAVLVVQATNQEDTVDFYVSDIWRGSIATNPLPPEVKSSLAKLKDGESAVVFIQVKSVMSRQSSISGLRANVVSIARINGDTVTYLGPKPGQISTGKQISAFTLSAFKTLVTDKDQPTKGSTLLPEGAAPSGKK
jgi:hypothetical protein